MPATSTRSTLTLAEKLQSFSYVTSSFLIPSRSKPFFLPLQRLPHSFASILQCYGSCYIFHALENASCGVVTESARVNPRRGLLGPKHHACVSRGLRLDRRCSLQACHAASWTRIYFGNPPSWRGRSSWPPQIFPLPGRLKVQRLDRPFSFTDQRLRSFRSRHPFSRTAPALYSSAS